MARRHGADASCPTPTNSNFKQQIQFHGLAALVARGLLRSLAPRIRGRRECRVRAAPAVPCAKKVEDAHEHTGSAETLRHSLRNGFTVYFALFPENQACLTPSPSDMARARPVGPTRLRRLDANHEASGPHDFTVRTAPFVSRRLIAHGVDPALPSRVTPDAAASTASRPNVSDDPDTPLRDRTAVDMQVIWGRRQGQFLKIGTLPPMHRGLDRFKATLRRTTDCMLCSQYRGLDWCGLVDVRDAPIATEFCVAEEYRDVPLNEPALAGRCGGAAGVLRLAP